MDDAADQRIAEIWAESARKYNVARKQALAWEWLNYHQGMLRNHEHTIGLLTGHHRAEIRKYEKLLGIEHDDARPT